MGEGDTAKYKKTLKVTQFSKAGYVVSDNVYSKAISLPSSYGLTNRQQDYIISNIINFYQ